MTKQNQSSKNYSLSEWCELRALSEEVALKVIRNGEIQTFESKGKIYISEEADRAFIRTRERQETVINQIVRKGLK